MTNAKSFFKRVPITPSSRFSCSCFRSKQPVTPCYKNNVHGVISYGKSTPQCYRQLLHIYALSYSRPQSQSATNALLRHIASRPDHTRRQVDDCCSPRFFFARRATRREFDRSAVIALLFISLVIAAVAPLILLERVGHPASRHAVNCINCSQLGIMSLETDHCGRDD